MINIDSSLAPLNMNNEYDHTNQSLIINKDDSCNDDNIFLIQSILSQFIPFYSSLTITQKSSNEFKIISINSLISILDSSSLLTKKNKGKIFSENHSQLKFEEKEFLYKAYISSSDTNQPNRKIFQENTLQISTLTSQMIRSILILLREELLNNDISKHILIKKLSLIKTMVINEVKSFDYRNLFIFLHYVVLVFCNNLNELFIERLFNSKVEQVETMIKNSVYLDFIYKSSTICKLTLMNKVECLNENIIFKILYEYINKNNIIDVDPEAIEIHKINILNILLHKKNIKTLVLKRMTIDKIQMIEEIIDIIMRNKQIKKLCIDKFISIPDNYLDGIMKSITSLQLMNKVKLCISSSSIKILRELLTIPLLIDQLKRITIKLNRISINESDIKDQIILLKQSNLQKLTLMTEQFNLLSTHSLIFQFLPPCLKKLSLGFIDHIGLRAVRNTIMFNLIKLINLKIHFLPINDEHYDQAYKDILAIIQHGRIHNIFFYNFILKYKSIADEEIKEILRDNTILRRLVIKSDIPFHIQNIEGYFYYDLPVYLIEPLLFLFKKHPHFRLFYNKKRILNWICQFFRIKKDKAITINYQV